MVVYGLRNSRTRPIGDRWRRPLLRTRQEDPAELEQLAPAWQALAQVYGPTEQFVWATSCLATLDAGRPLRVLSLDHDQQLVALAPLVLRRIRGIRRLALIGVNDLHEPADFLAVDDDVCAAWPC